jgi:hypothetical protein
MKKIILEQVDKLNVKDKAKYDADIKSGFKMTTAKEFNTDTSNYEYKSYGTGYSPAIQLVYVRKKKKVVATPAPDDEKDKKKPAYDSVKLPFTKSAESDAFRAWLLKTYPEYGDSKIKGSLSVAKPPQSKYITSESLKNAYYDKGAEYEKWVAGGGKVDPSTFVVTDGSVTSTPIVSAGGGSNIVGGNTGGVISDLQTIKRQGCKSIGNKSKFLGLGTTDEARNDAMRSFLSWWKKTFNRIYFVSNGTCGMYPDSSPDMWIYNKLYDEDGNTYYAWSDETLNKLADVTEEVDGEDISYFDRWLKYREGLPQNTKKGAGTTTTKTGTADKKETEDVKNTNKLKFASDIVKKDKQVLRKNCANLNNVLNSFDYDYGDADINVQIEKCQTQYNRLMTKVKKESIENKITGKLKLMKENKQLIGKVSDKLKTKKLEKISENFFKQNYRKFFDTYSKYVKSNNMISEATNDEFSKSFDVIFKGKEEEFKKRAIEYIISKLEITPSSPLANEIKNELSKTPAKDLFTNEYDIPEAVTNAIEKTNSKTSTSETGLKGIVSKSIKIDDKQVKQEVRKHLHDYVEGVKDDIKSLEQKIKSSIIQGA